MLETKSADLEAEGCPALEGERQRRGWHIKREVDLGAVFVSILMVCGFFVWALSQERRLNSEENATIYINKDMKELKEMVARDKTETRDDIKDIKRMLEDLRSNRRN